MQQQTVSVKGAEPIAFGVREKIDIDAAGAADRVDIKLAAAVQRPEVAAEEGCCL